MEKMSHLPSCVPQTTYKTNFKGELSSLPLIKYKTLPCLYPPGSSVPCRKQAHGVVTACQRPLLKPRPTKPQGPSVSYAIYNKPTQRSTLSYNAHHVPDSGKVFDTKFGPMDMATVEKLYTKTRYTTFAQKAANEVSFQMFKVEPPNTTKEEKPDLIRLKGQRYESEPELWQDAVLWDRIQSRVPNDRRPITPQKEKLLQRRETVDMVGNEQHEKIRQLVKVDALSNVFVRKCPGYSGYNPLCPPETELQGYAAPVEMTSLMSASYRQFPDSIYEKQTYARRGPFSKTVTLTYPFNPFNKIGEEITPFKRECVYKHMTDSMDIMTG